MRHSELGSFQVAEHMLEYFFDLGESAHVVKRVYEVDIIGHHAG